MTITTNIFGVPVPLITTHTLALIGIVLIVVILVRYLKVIDRFWDRFIAVKDQPIISARDYGNSADLRDMAMGKMNDTGYLYNLRTNDAGRIMIEIRLDHSTDIHIVAIGAESDLDARLGYLISHRLLEPVMLEGDFPEHFKLYCTRGGQIEVRQVFGPETMATFVDFCSSYNFELFDNKVYISMADGAENPDDPTSLTTDILEFVRHNKKVFDNLG